MSTTPERLGAPCVPIANVRPDALLAAKRYLRRAQERTKQAVGKALANAFTGRLIARLYRDRIPAGDLLMDTSSPLILPEVKALLALGMYESAERRLVTTHLRCDLPVVELGASIGYVTGHISRRVPPRHVAVEANALLFPLIERLLQLNGLPMVQLIHGAIDYSGQSTVRFCVHSFNTGSTVVDGERESHDASEVEVPSFTLRDIVVREALEEFAMVCDIEGAERALIMEEDLHVIQRCQQMVIELHSGIYKHQHMSSDSLARAVKERWEMQPVLRDGNNWLFGRS